MLIGNSYQWHHEKVMLRIPVTEPDYAMSLIDNAWAIFHGQENKWGIGGFRRGRKSTITAPSNCQWEVAAAWRRSRIITMTMTVTTNTLLMMMMTTTKYVVFSWLCCRLCLWGTPHSPIYINYLTNSSKIVQLHLLPHFLVVVVFTLIALSALLSLLSYLPPFYFLFCA